ncbi:triose-phosphate isomerase [Quadrisphaera sp. INWT6]|uniref:triose-phosphate isomerase n=1 Tax=Quadrisphaera sp. INWT6 TaxID=2596917 RepID=UPI0028169793|nr:triose-phosphate isomerase [Quadrisphaera sp. INWT6]
MDAAQRWVGTGWKMTKTRAEGVAWARAVVRAAAERGGESAWPGVQPFVLPPATAITQVAEALRAPGTSRVLVGAQDAHWEDSGAWTGELSVPQVADAGAQMVELGHSERREHFAETDERVALKVAAVLRHGLMPLVCVGETAEQRDAGRSVDVVLTQARAALGAAGDRRCVLAYEPVWAIGERGREARPEEVAPVVAALAGLVVDSGGGPSRNPVLYGGSVTVEGAPGVLEVPGVDGLFVGRTAWRAEGFVALLDLVSG